MTLTEITWVVIILGYIAVGAFVVQQIIYYRKRKKMLQERNQLGEKLPDIICRIGTDTTNNKKN